MAQTTATKNKRWYEKISRLGYFFGALLLHLIVFIIVAAWVIFPAFQQTTTSFSPVYLTPHQPPPPAPPPSNPVPDISSQTDSVAPIVPIVARNPSASINIRTPDMPSPLSLVQPHDIMRRADSPMPKGISPERLKKIENFVKTYRLDDPLTSGGDPRNIKAKFPVYLASYADGDWSCNVHLTDGKIDAGSLPNLIAKVSEWSHGNITAEVEPTPLNIGGPDLLAKKPPFIFFTGHKDFILTDQEIQNLRDYLQDGGCIWGDNTLAGRGSRFDVAFRREMKRVVTDLDKNFEPAQMDYDIFTKSWFPISKVPDGMNYYAEPLEHLDIDGAMAIIYTPNDYSDLFTMRILPGDATIEGDRPPRGSTSPLFTQGIFLQNKNTFFRDFDLPSCLAAHQLGMNIIGYLLVRFDKDLQLAP